MGYVDRQPSSRIIKTQTTAITTGTTSQSAASVFSSQTLQIRVASTIGCWIKYGDGAQTAAATDVYLPANWVDYFTVSPGQTFAFLSTSTSSGLFSLTEMG